MTTTAIIETCREQDRAEDIADLYAQLDADEGFDVDVDDEC